MSQSRKYAKLVTFLVIGIAFCVNIYAQTSEEGEQPVSSRPDDYLSEETYIPFVSDVEVMGNQIISSNTIINKIKTQKGKELLREVVNDDIKRLYATGYFQDVRFDLVPDGNNFKVIVVVDEKPVVKSIVIQGNETFSADVLRKEISIEPGEILDHHLLKEGVTAIQRKYLDKGFKFVKVGSRVDVTKYTKEATIFITVTEGEKYKIKEIKFEGVTAFKARFLKRKMRTKQDAFWRQWFWSAIFKDKKFQTDLERIAYLYQREGYLDVTLTPDFRYDEKDNKMIIVIDVYEGKQYITGDIRIDGNLLFPESEIWGQLEMLPGEVYSQVGLQDDLDAMRRFYFERGYINARIIPETNLNKDTSRVDLLYRIAEGDLYYVDKVKIRGNSKTKDKVIRRELRVRPGDRFDGEKLEYSTARLDNLGFFEDVWYDTEPGSAPTKRDVVFGVKEKQTGELSFGGGVSSIDQFVGFAEISQRNFDLLKWPTFTGGGQSISLSARLGSVTQDVDFTFVEPYLFNRQISFSVNIYNRYLESNNVDYDTRRRGGAFTFGKRFTDRIKGNIGYTFENVKISDISSDADPQVRASGEENNLNRGRVGLIYDSRDSVFFPRKGWYITSSAELVVGDQDYYNLQLGIIKYFSFRKDHVIEFKNRFGVTNNFGDSDQVPVFDRFYAGGLGTVRGFGYRRVGPQGGGDPIGGETLILNSVEYTFPIIENFKGAAFVDAGHVNSDALSVDMGEFGVSVGPGIKINTPLGPIALYYGFPIANEDDQYENGRLEFNLSRGF